MHRRELLKKSATLGFAAALPFPLSATGYGHSGASTPPWPVVDPDLEPRRIRRPANGGPIRCSLGHKRVFDATPERVLADSRGVPRE
jgi:hypothetical protein